MPDESARGLVELHEDVAGTIIRNEELVLSELDRVSIRSDLVLYILWTLLDEG